MATRILLVFSVICSSVAIHLHKECEAISTLEIAYGWSTTDISVWVPSEDSPFLTIEIEFEGYNFPKYYDLIKVSRSNISVEFIRERNFQTITNKMNQMISQGWADITMSLELNYGLTYHNHNMVLPMNSSVEFFPKLIRLKGSNVTINCPIGQRMWKISDKPVYLPFENSEPQNFYTFSVREFLPVMFIESRKVALGWYEGTYTTIESKAKKLPAFEKHNLVISCLNEREHICIVKVGSTRIIEEEEFKLGNVPRSISFRSQLGSTFYLIHQNNRSVSLELETSSDRECIQGTKFSTAAAWKDSTVIGVTMFLVWVSLLSICFILMQKMKTRSNARKRHESVRSESGTSLCRKSSSKDTWQGSEDGDSTETGLMMNSKCRCKHEDELSKNDASKDSDAKGHKLRMRSSGKKHKNRKLRKSALW